MNDEIMSAQRVSAVTPDTVAQYLRLDEPDTADLTLLDTMLSAAKGYMRKYTGMDDEDLDDAGADLVIALLVLCSDMWDNRALVVEKGTVNRVVETILDLYSRNLLPND